MRENRDFVVPVNILTTFAHAPFSWAARHTTVCLDLLQYHIEIKILMLHIINIVYENQNMRVLWSIHLVKSSTVFLSLICGG